MSYARLSLTGDLETLPRMPSWVTSGRAETLEDVAFLCGAALAVLHSLVAVPRGDVPGALLRQRLALKAAQSCLKLEGRNESEAEIRDAICLTKAGDASGPAGEMFLRWSQLMRLDLTQRGWQERLAKRMPPEIADILPSCLAEVRGRRAVQTAAALLAKILSPCPHQEAAALICADVMLASVLGWSHPVPLLGWALPRKAVRAAGQREGNVPGWGSLPCEDNVPGEACLAACHRALAEAAVEAVRLSGDLSRRAARLQAVAPKLRAKGAPDALALFLSRDAVSPSGMLPSPPRVKGTAQVMSDRAARRLCDRLVELGVVRELTGRSSFRLYGL